MNLRIKKLNSSLKEQHLDGLIVSNPANISYLTKYRSRDSYLLVTKRENIYFTDFRYAEEVKQALRHKVTLKKVNGSVFKYIAAACLDLGLKKIAFEERYMPFAEYDKIIDYLNNLAVLIATHGIIEELRQIKEPEEIEQIKKGMKITSLVFEFINSLIKPGIRELEVVAELERFIRYQGASGPSFEIIVASGANSSLPHHIPGSRKIQSNEPVLIDLGVDCSGYKTDLTRIFFSGRINALVRKVYDIVAFSQREAIKKIKPCVKLAKIDAAARQYITSKGYGRFFGHALGHGIGLEVHEYPKISGKEQTELKPGMVFTVEPAIYLPKQFGIRIEDMVLVTEKGHEVLSGAINK